MFKGAAVGILAFKFAKPEKSQCLSEGPAAPPLWFRCCGFDFNFLNIGRGGKSPNKYTTNEVNFHAVPDSKFLGVSKYRQINVDR